MAEHHYFTSISVLFVHHTCIHHGSTGGTQIKASFKTFIQSEAKLTFRLFALQTLLDGSRDATEQRVEMTSLRKVCAAGMIS
jgi:hypothetical protein